MSNPNAKPAAPAPVPAPAAAPTAVEVEIIRDYWPKGAAPEGWPLNPHTGGVSEYRVTAGSVVTLPLEEAFEVCEKGIARRTKFA